MLDEKKIKSTSSIHTILAYSYALQFVFFLVGLFFYFHFPVKIHDSDFIFYLGFIFLVVATLFIFWAQKTSRILNKNNISKEAFCQGPYRYTHTPTHLGLFVLMIGFSFLINSLFVTFFTFVSFLTSKLFFLKKEEKILLEKYGLHYSEYKKSVKF